MSTAREIIKRLKSNNSDKQERGLSFLTRFFPLSFIEPKKLPRLRKEDVDGFALIINSTEPKKLLDDIISKFYHWDKMSRVQRKILGDQMTSLVLSDFGMYYMFQKYDSKMIKEFGTMSEAQIELSSKDLLTANSPFPLFSTIVHEVQHRRQEFINCFAKKDQLTKGKSVTYYPAEYQAYESRLNQREQNDYYMASLFERDCDLVAFDYMLRIKKEISSRVFSLKRNELICDLEDYLDSENYRLRSHLQAEITLDKLYHKQENMKYSILKNAIDYSEKVKNYTPQQFEEYFKKCGHTDIQKYLYFATTHVDHSTHSKLIKTMLKHKRIEAVDLINTLGYFHSSDELFMASKLLLEHTDETMLLPTMFRYFTHISPTEIIRTAEEILPKSDVAIYEKALQLQFANDLAETKIREFNGITLDPTNREHYSFFLNCFYSENFDDFLDTFGPDYILDAIKVYSDQTHQESKFSDSEWQKMIENLISTIKQDNTLSIHDEIFELLDNSEGFSDNITLTAEELSRFGTTTAYHYNTEEHSK